MRIPTRTRVISVFIIGKSHVCVLCTQGLRTSLNQRHVQVPYQAANEHSESWFHVFALLEKAVGEHHSALSLWEACLCCPLWIYPLHTQICPDVWHSPWPHQGGVHQLSWPGSETTAIQSCTARRYRADQALRAIWKGVRELLHITWFLKTFGPDVWYCDALCHCLYQH